MASAEPTAARALASTLSSLPMPYVMVDRLIEDLACDKVAFNNEEGGYLATSHLLRAGHRQDNMRTDIFYNAGTDRILPLRSPRVETVNTRGTGCTLSSAFAAFLARGFELDEAATRAKEYIAAAIAAGARYEIGHGHGPVHHFFNFWE